MRVADRAIQDACDKLWQDIFNGWYPATFMQWHNVRWWWAYNHAPYKDKRQRIKYADIFSEIYSRGYLS